MPKATGVLERLRSAHDVGGETSPYRWFLRHHHQFASLLARVDRPSWKAIVVELAAEGLTMKNGAAITVAYARKAWSTADKAHKARKAATAPRAKRPAVAPAPGEAAPGVRPAQAQTTPDFGPSMPKNAPVALPSDPPAGTVGSARRLTPEQVQEQIRAVKDSLGGRRRLVTKMPSQVE